ncbi:MAG: fructose-6-phosphate aldolase [Verrucomicrobia bacterium]|nr:MAG: fructose-6-phosphate aldolase [Verrucomicrobiota bacterium]
MKIFIDSAEVDKIREAWDWGIIDGVTTNPSHVAKTGRRHLEVYREICRIVDGPISLETVTPTADEMVKEGRALARIHKNVVVKVPITKEGLKAVRRLTAERIKTNVTVTFSPLQALLAAKCGATYISPFVGRLDAIGHFGMEVVRQIKTIYTNYGFKTQVLTAAVRHPTHVLEAALAGSDVCTMSFEVLEQLYHHPLTEQGIDIFLKDWAKVPKA